MEEFPISNNFWQQFPLSIPSTCFSFLPAPVTWGWKLRVCNQHLSPNTTSLMRGSLGMLACSISTAFVGGNSSIVGVHWWTIAGELCSQNVHYLFCLTAIQWIFLKLVDGRRFICCIIVCTKGQYRILYLAKSQKASVTSLKSSTLSTPSEGMEHR